MSEQQQQNESGSIFDVISLGPWSVNPIHDKNGNTLYEICDLTGKRIGIMNKLEDAHVAIAGATILDRWTYVYEHAGAMYQAFGSAYYAALHSAGINIKRSSNNEA